MKETRKAVEKAIEGGYRHLNPVNYLDAEMAMTFLDPLFWRALGKTLGWKDASTNWSGWLGHWHVFINWIAEGKTPESFFEGLLATPTSDKEERK